MSDKTLDESFIEEFGDDKFDKYRKIKKKLIVDSKPDTLSQSFDPKMSLGTPTGVTTGGGYGYASSFGEDSKSTLKRLKSQIITDDDQSGDPKETQFIANTENVSADSVVTVKGGDKVVINPIAIKSSGPL